MELNRREFLKNSGLMVAGTMIVPGCGSRSSGDSGSTTESPTPEVGLQTYTVREALGADIEGTLQKIADIGYTHLELHGYGERSFFGVPAADYYAMIKGTGLSVTSGHYLSGLAQVDGQGTLTNGWEEAVEDAATAGQQYMACAYLFPDERSPEHYARLPDLLNRAGETCRQAGIQFCYHNHEFEFEETGGMIPMYHILDETDPELVKMEADLYWFTYAGIDPIAFFERYPGRTPLWHLKDMNNIEEKKFTEVGDGIVDFKNIFENGDKSGMKSFFVEQDRSEQPLKSIEISYNNLLQII